MAVLERLGRSREARRDSRRNDLRRSRFNRGRRSPECNAWSRVERNRNRRKLARVRNREWTDVLRDVRHCAQRNKVALLRANVEHAERVDVTLKFRLELHDHEVLIVGRVDRRHLARAVRVVQGGFDLLRANAQRRRPVTIYRNHCQTRSLAPESRILEQVFDRFRQRSVSIADLRMNIG